MCGVGVWFFFLLAGFDAVFVWLSSLGLFGEKGTVLTQ